MGNDNIARLRVAALIYCMVNAITLASGDLGFEHTCVTPQRHLLEFRSAPWVMMRFLKANSIHWNG